MKGEKFILFSCFYEVIKGVDFNCVINLFVVS